MKLAEPLDQVVEDGPVGKERAVLLDDEVFDLTGAVFLGRGGDPRHGRVAPGVHAPRVLEIRGHLRTRDVGSVFESQRLDRPLSDTHKRHE